MSIRHSIRFLPVLAVAVFLTSAAFADDAAVLGTWSITIDDEDFEDADLEITLIIEKDEDGGLTGTWETERGEDDLEDVEWNGKKLTFLRLVEVLDREVEVEHTARIKETPSRARWSCPCAKSSSPGSARKTEGRRARADEARARTASGRIRRSPDTQRVAVDCH